VSQECVRSVSHCMHVFPVPERLPATFSAGLHARPLQVWRVYRPAVVLLCPGHHVALKPASLSAAELAGTVVADLSWLVLRGAPIIDVHKRLIYIAILSEARQAQGCRGTGRGSLNINPDAPISSVRQLVVKGPGNRGGWKPARTQWIRWICALRKR